MSDVDNVAAPRPRNPSPKYEFFIILAKIVITVLFMYPLVHYSFYGGEKSVENAEEIVPNSYNITMKLQEEITTPNKTTKTKMVVILPPSCPTPKTEAVLDQLFEDYILRSTCCTPEDIGNAEKHKIPVNSARQTSPSDPRANIVSFVTVGFLVVSLIATFVELYRAKQQSPTKAKAPLTRKCSLADLTIMKHQRKELVRRDSILEGPEETKPAHYKRAPPLQRSSSTPVEPISEISGYNYSRSFDSRRCSIIDNHPSDSINSRLSLEGRRSSILERRPSIIDGKFIDRFDQSGRRISIDITSSPERKHHSRLVHRH